MLKLKLFSVGKTKEAWLDEAVQEYTKRLKPSLAIEYVWAKDDRQLIDLVQKEPLVITLDPKGRLLDSHQFAEFLAKSFVQGDSRLAMVIGGAAGLPEELRQLPLSISLSPLTFTHQIARLVLMEQIYRAFELNRGSPYHK